MGQLNGRDHPQDNKRSANRRPLTKQERLAAEQDDGIDDKLSTLVLPEISIAPPQSPPLPRIEGMDGHEAVAEAWLKAFMNAYPATRIESIDRDERDVFYALMRQLGSFLIEHKPCSGVCIYLPQPDFSPFSRSIISEWGGTKVHPRGMRHYFHGAWVYFQFRGS
ncbi:MAG: hypothetical protein COY40_01915 [Alphaproteobacteria bacterium CG_4_10_14_0_8_um_filter_53_9]|nr:MAG: hypothetical protein COY40_01915 [Alphaproteobacteria bacterium CG_4_10_14_0_8_um_filter_53_9]